MDLAKEENQTECVTALENAARARTEAAGAGAAAEEAIDPALLGRAQAECESWSSYGPRVLKVINDEDDLEKGLAVRNERGGGSYMSS